MDSPQPRNYATAPLYDLDFYDFTAEVTGRDVNNINVVIPDQISINGRIFVVNSIGISAFSEESFKKDIPNSKRLKSVHIGDSVSSIKHFAFSECKNLSDIKLGDHIKYVGKRIFSSSNINNLEIVDEAKELGFYDISNRKSYKGVYVNGSLDDVNSIKLCFIDVPIIDIRADKVGTMIISGIKCIPDKTMIIYSDYNGDTSYIRNSYLREGGIENLIINADNKEIPNLYDANIKNLIILSAQPPQFNKYFFRDKAYLETNLYVLDSAYSKFLNDPEWRRFLNIKKFSEIENSLSPEVKSKLRFGPLNSLEPIRPLPSKTL